MEWTTNTDTWYTAWKASVNEKIENKKLRNSIPRIIHQIWLTGPKPMPLQYRKWSETWQALAFRSSGDTAPTDSDNPSWSYKLWTDKDVDLVLPVGTSNRKLFDVCSLGKKVDILRYEILFQIGGLYVDMDMERVGNFEEIHPFWDFYTGMASTSAPLEINNAIIGSVREHAILATLLSSIYKNEAIIQSIPAEVVLHSKSSVMSNVFKFMEGSEKTLLEKITAQASCDNVIADTGPGMFTKTLVNLTDNIFNSSLLIYPPETFYPIPKTSNKIPINQSKSFAIHYWGISWASS